jgi:hypothetical protein
MSLEARVAARGAIQTQLGESTRRSRREVSAKARQTRAIFAANAVTIARNQQRSASAGTPQAANLQRSASGRAAGHLFRLDISPPTLIIVHGENQD